MLAYAISPTINRALYLVSRCVRLWLYRWIYLDVGQALHLSHVPTTRTRDIVSLFIIALLRP